MASPLADQTPSQSTTCFRAIAKNQQAVYVRDTRLASTSPCLQQVSAAIFCSPQDDRARSPVPPVLSATHGPFGPSGPLTARMFFSEAEPPRAVDFSRVMHAPDLLEHFDALASLRSYARGRMNSLPRMAPCGKRRPSGVHISVLNPHHPQNLRRGFFAVTRGLRVLVRATVNRPFAAARQKPGF